MHIQIDNLSDQAICQLLQEHQKQLSQTSPPESCHVLNLDALRTPEITVWSAWHKQELMGCGALKELTPDTGEIKSMRTVAAHLNKGVASSILRTIMETAQSRGYTQLLLETGSMQEFIAARALYSRFGFSLCEPFGDYLEDPNSLYMKYDFTADHQL